MDGANKAMKSVAYKHIRLNIWRKSKKLEAATMFDINKTIMRCLVKKHCYVWAWFFISIQEKTYLNKLSKRLHLNKLQN